MRQNTCHHSQEEKRHSLEETERHLDDKRRGYKTNEINITVLFGGGLYIYTQIPQKAKRGT